MPRIKNVVSNAVRNAFVKCHSIKNDGEIAVNRTKYG